MARYGTNGDRKRSPFRFLRIFLEIPVIVLSIYIAFVVDEYGRNKEEANLERKYLEELLEETRINEAELKADQDARRSQIALMDKLLETAVRTVDPDTLLLAMDQLLSIRIYSPTDAVYSDLVSSGNLRLISSDSVRKYILYYQGALSRKDVTELSDINLVENKLEPYLVEQQVLSLLEPYRDSPSINISRQQTDRIIRVLLNDRKFIDLVYLRRNRIRDTEYFANPMQWYLRNIRELIEKQLAEGKE